MGRIQTINYNHYEQEGSKLDALITVRGHNSTVFIGIRDGLFQCSSVPSEKKPNARSQHFPSPWSGRVQTQSCKLRKSLF